MKLTHLGALLGASAMLLASQAQADPIRFRGPVTLPSGIVTQGEVEVSSDNPLPVTGGGGGGGGGAVTAAANAYALGAIVDLGTGSSPGANTTNGYLKANGGYLSSLVTNTTGLATAAGQGTLLAAVQGPVPLQTGDKIIGGVGIDPTHNGTQDAATGSTASAVPSKAIYAGAQSGGNLTGIVQANASAFLNMTTATTTKIITGASSKKVYITAFRVHAGGSTTAKFVEGTGTNCGTGTADLSETWDLTASDGSNQGNGLGPVLVMATAGDDVCVTNSAAQNLRVGAAYETH